MKEDDDIIESTEDHLNQGLSSFKSSDIISNYDEVDDKQEKQNIISKLAYGEEIAPIINNFAMNCKHDLNICIDNNGPSVIIHLPYLTKLFEMFKLNSINKRIVTEITPDNMEYCKQIVQDYDVELRHLPGIKCNLAISDDREYLASSTLQENKAPSEIIYSTVKEIVNQNRLVFDSIWNRAVSAEQRIQEIEERVLPLKTYLINNTAEAFEYAQNLVENADTGFSNSTSIDYFKLLDGNPVLLRAYLNHLSKYREGKVRGGIRWITHIRNKKEDIELIKKFIDFGIEIRHISNPPPLYFSVSQKQCVTSIEYIPNVAKFQRIIHSTEPLYISHYQAVFEELWDLGLNAIERIRQLETGTILATTRIVENPIKTKQYFIGIVQNAKEEILILFPSLNAVKREVVMGIMDSLKKKSIENVTIRILSPVNEYVKELLLPKVESNNYKDKVRQNIISREIKKQDYLISTIVIVDRKYVLATELKDDSKELFEEAIGVSTYSTSKPTVLSYISIFESLWDQTEMSESLKMANEKLVRSEEMEREFINTAAHELRTPTQAIMGYSELDMDEFEDLLENAKVMNDDELKRTVSNLKAHFDAISRNSTRLNQLINNLLDVARIESNRSNSLQIQKEKLDLVKEITNSINTEYEQKIKNKNIKIDFKSECGSEQCWTYADKLRLIQIINNLIGNAITHTKHNGKIQIRIKESDTNGSELNIGKKIMSIENGTLDAEEKEIGNRKKDKIFVSISDTGLGISPDIMPKLFEKFNTNSEAGTGLGLYITRNLVEAHGGRIWAFNNANGIGATFVFSLPKVDEANSIGT